MSTNNNRPKNKIQRFDRAQALVTLQDYLKKASGTFGKQVPSSFSAMLTPDKVIKHVMLDAAKKGSLLPKCTPTSIVQALIQSCSLGLLPGGALQQCYLVPYRNKQLKPPYEYEAQLIIGYRGYVGLARRSGEIQSVEARAVHMEDRCHIKLGTATSIEHEINFEVDDPGELRLVYCVAHFKDGGMHVDVMTKREVDRIKQRSPAARSESSPWHTDYEEMAKKTVVRRASKYWPLTIEMADAATADADNDDRVMDATLSDEDDEVSDTDEPQIEDPKPQQLDAHVDNAAERFGAASDDDKEPVPVAKREPKLDDMGYDVDGAQ